jgi:hypothetical protein
MARELDFRGNAMATELPVTRCFGDVTRYVNKYGVNRDNRKRFETQRDAM